MPSGASWVLAEEITFIQYLHDHLSEAGDGAAFKGAMYQKALTHISHLHEHGAPKDVKSLQNKWTMVCFFHPLFVINTNNVNIV